MSPRRPPLSRIRWPRPIILCTSRSAARRPAKNRLGSGPIRLGSPVLADAEDRLKVGRGGGRKSYRHDTIEEPSKDVSDPAPQPASQESRGWLVRRQGFKGKGSGAKEDPSPASDFIIDNEITKSQRKNVKYFISPVHFRAIGEADADSGTLGPTQMAKRSDRRRGERFGNVRASRYINREDRRCPGRLREPTRNGRRS